MSDISFADGSTITASPLEQLAKEFRFVIDLMPQMVWATQAEGYHDFYNQRWFDFTGLTYEDTKDTGWSLVLHPDDSDRAWKVWQHSLDTGALYEVEYRMRRFDGTYIWFLARAQPLRDDSGKIVKWFGTCTDIQEQREILDELENTKDELRISNENLNDSIATLSRINLELDNFVYSASHDLKAPLNNLEGLLTLIEPSDDSDPNQEILKLIGNSVKRFKEVVNDMTLMVQTAKADQQMHNISFPVLLNQITSDLSHLISSTEAVIHFDLETQQIQYPRKEIRSILLNLISNGIKYHEPGRSPIITVRTRENSDGVLLEVEDNGCGIAEEYMPELFDKYFRINTNTEGSGLGLFIVKRMVENRGGRLEVTSTVSKGSLFSVFLKQQG